MAEENHYFDQLLPGKYASSHLHPFSSRIPHDENAAAIQVRILLQHVDEVAQEAMEEIRNILRWHGGEIIRSQIRPQERELLPKLEAFVGSEDCESDDA